ncbi:MAG: hypothetical protein CMO80_12020 [Verrucomicrobiales bacterium]|nr:hypothetical protein [Verrucomicrobiales bacterium]
MLASSNLGGRTIRRWISLLVFGAVATGSFSAAATQFEKHPGRGIYQKLCSECHGPMGEAVAGKTDDPLRGNRDLTSLTRRIERTMPEDNADKCVGEDAKAVAGYIYHLFYSEAARARKTPARVELNRLTVAQYRNSIADLVLGFRGSIDIRQERGLKGSYYGSYRLDPNKKGMGHFNRVDDRVRFDFGEDIPGEAKKKLGEWAKLNDEQKKKLKKNSEVPGKFAADEFAIRWEGVLLPDESGTHQFVIRTRNGASLWVNRHHNDHEIREGTKTIDGYVAPGNKLRELQAEVFLIGGRPYPIRLEFFKYKGKRAQIELLWKQPHGVLRTIPKRNLAPQIIHDSLTVAVPFPADDRSVGYERGSSVSRTWLEAVTSGASEAAAFVVRHLNELAGTDSKQADREEKIREFGRQFVERAFRRPLSGNEARLFVGPHFDRADTVEQGARRLVLFALTSPRFLYPGLPHDSAPDQWDIASRLSLALWDSLPDQRLRGLVRLNQLKTPKQIERAAGQMARDWRSKAKLRGFFHHWLELDRAAELAKDDKIFPEFDELVLADLRTSLNLFLDEAVWGKDGNYRQLLLADYTFLNQRLGKLYGRTDLRSGFQKVSLNPKQRSGIITHPLLLASLAYHNDTSPIHRGVFLTRNIVGMSLKSPPMANEFKDTGFDPKLTMREKVTELTRAKACMGCHVTINPLGFSLENYDGIGRWRTHDKNKPVDSTSEFRTETGTTIRLTGARDVAKFAADTPSAHRAFIQQLFHHTVKQPVLAFGETTMEELRNVFQQSNFNVPELIRSIALKSAMHGWNPDAN